GGGARDHRPEAGRGRDPPAPDPHPVHRGGGGPGLRALGGAGAGLRVHGLGVRRGLDAEPAGPAPGAGLHLGGRRERGPRVQGPQRGALLLARRGAAWPCVVLAAAPLAPGRHLPGPRLRPSRRGGHPGALPAREALGRPLTALLPERCHEAYQSEVGDLLSAGAPSVGRTVEVAARRSDGTEFPVELSLANWEARGQTFVTAIIRDITDRRQAE